MHSGPRQQFYETLNRFSTSQLEDMVARYPYQHQAHLLLAKKYQLENNPAFDKQLQLAALYTQDRELFYSLFNEQPIATTKATGHTQTPPVVEPEEILPESTETEQLVPDEQPPASNETPTVQETFETAVTEAVEDIAPIAEVVAETPGIEPLSEEKEQLTVNPETLPLIENEEPPVDLIAPPAPETTPALTETEETTTKPNTPTEEVTETTPVEEEVSHEEPETEEPVELPEGFKLKAHTFDEWLIAYRQPGTNTPKVSENQAEQTEEEDDELEKLIAENTPIDLLHELVEEETRYSKGLEAFIDEQIKKRRQAEVKKAAPENEIDPAMATETLARLYEAQKKYNKAIRMYEALSLKFPEKSDLFAARINYLKNLT